MKPEITQQLRNKIPDLIKILRNSEAIKGRDLSKAIGVSERQLRLMVNYARINISPLITSDNSGYRWETDIEKVRGTIKRTRAHAFSELRVCQQQEKLLSEENRL